MLKKKIQHFVQRLMPGRRNGPERLSREQHGIDRRQVSRHAIKVCEVLRQHGYEAYIVGGAVRDLIVGLAPKDFDVATNATPAQVRPLFRRARIIGRRFQLVHVVFGPEIIETSTFRAPSRETQKTDEHGRILSDNEFGSHSEDAARRDFTLNALYYDPISEEVIDYHRGVHDLKQRVVRMIGDPEQRYREDPVRILRALRFAAKLDATIAPATEAPISRTAPLLRNVPESRLFEEILKLLTCGHAMEALRRLHEARLDKGVLPLVEAIFEDQASEHFADLALSRTDARVRAGKTISPGFLFAALLWPPVSRLAQQLRDQGSRPLEALMQAGDQILDHQARQMAVQKRFQSDMREIWFMQPRLERFNARACWRLMEQPRFRAAVDFLQLRAEAREVDSVDAQWWMDLANAAPERRTQMIEDRAARGEEAPAARRRRRPRKRRPAQAAAGDGG